MRDAYAMHLHSVQSRCFVKAIPEPSLRSVNCTLFSIVIKSNIVSYNYLLYIILPK